MMLDSVKIEEFLNKYKKALTVAYGKEITNGLQGFADARDDLFQNLENMRSSLLNAVGSEFLISLNGAIFGQFVYYKRFANGHVFRNLQNETFYRVAALNTPIDELTKNFCIVKTALMPFKGLMVCDGLIESNNTCLGTNLIKELEICFKSENKMGRVVSA